MRVETVSIIYQHPRILLGMKKKKLGKGRYNGFGGGIEGEESVIDCAIRETLEEASITLVDPEIMGRILFNFESDEQDHLVYFIRASQYTGDPQESDEMTCEWFEIDKIPYDKMWSSDRYWLPILLGGKKFEGNLVFNENHQIVRYTLDIVSNVEEMKHNNSY